jgi:hypothetical protein
MTATDRTEYALIGMALAKMMKLMASETAGSA